MERRRAMWVSHNKVLVGSGDGMGKKPHARNPNFDSEETKLLIQLWGDPQVQRTLITIHKKHPVIAKIAEKMRAYGYNRSTEEINTRIKNLKCLYNRIKKDLDSGLLNEPSWRHYQAMDEILSRPVFGNSNKVMPGGKIIISHLPTSNASSPSLGDNSMLQVKEEEMSDDDGCEDSDMMDYEASELRPEDLLNVIDNESTEEKANIKEEPMDSCGTVLQSMLSDKKSDPTAADSSTDANKKSIPETNPSSIVSVPTSNHMTKNIINYANDSLSIASVASGGSTSAAPTTVSPKITATQATSSKISLVPTKLLLKQAGTNFKQGSTIVYTSQPATTHVGTITTNAQSSSSIPMKVVFVNAQQNNSANVQQQGQKTQIIINKSQMAQLQNQSAANSLNKLMGNAQNATHKVQLVPSSNFQTVPKVSTTVNSSENHHKSSKSLLGNKLPGMISAIPN